MRRDRPGEGTQGEESAQGRGVAKRAGDTHTHRHNGTRETRGGEDTRAHRQSEDSRTHGKGEKDTPHTHTHRAGGTRTGRMVRMGTSSWLVCSAPVVEFV